MKVTRTSPVARTSPGAITSPGAMTSPGTIKSPGAMTSPVALMKATSTQGQVIEDQVACLSYLKVSSLFGIQHSDLSLWQNIKY